MQNTRGSPIQRHTAGLLYPYCEQKMQNKRVPAGQKEPEKCDLGSSIVMNVFVQ